MINSPMQTYFGSSVLPSLLTSIVLLLLGAVAFFVDLMWLNLPFLLAFLACFVTIPVAMVYQLTQNTWLKALISGMLMTGLFILTGIVVLIYLSTKAFEALPALSVSMRESLISQQPHSSTMKQWEDEQLKDLMSDLELSLQDNQTIELSEEAFSQLVWALGKPNVVMFSLDVQPEEVTHWKLSYQGNPLQEEFINLDGQGKLTIEQGQVSNLEIHQMVVGEYSLDDLQYISKEYLSETIRKNILEMQVSSPEFDSFFNHFQSVQFHDDSVSVKLNLDTIKMLKEEGFFQDPNAFREQFVLEPPPL